MFIVAIKPQPIYTIQSPLVAVAWEEYKISPTCVVFIEELTNASKAKLVIDFYATFDYSITVYIKHVVNEYCLTAVSKWCVELI